MPLTSYRNPQLVESLDWLFGRISGKLTGYTIPADIFQTSGASTPLPLPGALAYEGPGAPPALDGPADLQAAYEWLQGEKARLEEYTRSQFALIRQQHEAAMAKHFRGEEALTLRTQELNREMAFLASQSEAVQQRARELGEWESALSQQTDQLRHAQAELLRVQQTSEDIQRDTEAQRAFLESLQAETAQRQAGARAARAEFEILQATLKTHQQAWEQKQEEITQRAAQMEERYQALEKAEEAVKRRLKELDELEDRLHQEFEEQEQRLARERREIAGLLLEAQAVGCRRERGPGAYVPRLMPIGAGMRE
jgi:chromosome segregation ATPase